MYVKVPSDVLRIFGVDVRVLQVRAGRDTESPKPDKDLMNQSLTIEINRVLERLSHKEAQVIKMYYGIGLPSASSLNEIGDLFDLSIERVRQLKQKAIRNPQSKSRTHLLKSYLG